MTRHRFGSPSVPVLLVVAFVLSAGVASAGQRVAAAARQVPGGGPGQLRTAQPASRGGMPDGETAAQTRGQLNAVLQKYPPSLGRILKLDPTLLTNQAYLSAYPEMAAFLAAHSEIARDPRYFLEAVSLGNETRAPDPQQEALWMWRNMIEGLAMFLVFLVIVGAIVWLGRSLIEHRRWLRSSKVQLELHSKLFDRFSNNEELLAYVQSPAGRRFLESLAVGVDVGPQDVGMPVRRILWAVQVGVVLAAGGCGLMIVAGRVIQEMQQPLFALGVVVVSLGIGFVASAVTSFVLARRLGVLTDRRAPVAGA